MVHEIITSRIIELLEGGNIPWKKPWHTLAPSNLISRRPYRGINAFLLNALSFECSYFVTFNQSKQLNGRVRRGEKGCPIVYWQSVERENAEGEKEILPLLRYYTVFNVSQCDGIKTPELFPVRQIAPLRACEKIVQGMPLPPRIEHGGNQAAYYPTPDVIAMPVMNQFTSAADYYSTLFHELVHSVGHSKRLARKGVTEAGVNFGSSIYSNEELIAEMGASFLCGNAGIENETIGNSASYIKGWLARLKADARLVISTAGAAQKATDYILGLSAPVGSGE